MDNYKHSDITAAIIRCFYDVYNKLGYGFLEKVYEKALLIELHKAGLKCIAQCPIPVFYYDKRVGEYFADIIVNSFVIIEVKAAETLCDEHEKQLINYLKATDMEVGLLLNFGRTPQCKRKVFSSSYKSLNRS